MRWACTIPVWTAGLALGDQVHAQTTTANTQLPADMPQRRTDYSVHSANLRISLQGVTEPTGYSTDLPWSESELEHGLVRLEGVFATFASETNASGRLVRMNPTDGCANDGPISLDSRALASMKMEVNTTHGHGNHQEQCEEKQECDGEDMVRPHPPPSSLGEQFIAVVDRRPIGRCTFLAKAQNALDAGAVAVVIIMEPEDPPVNILVGEDSVPMPVVSVSHTVGQRIMHLMGQRAYIDMGQELKPVLNFFISKYLHDAAVATCVVLAVLVIIMTIRTIIENRRKYREELQKVEVQKRVYELMASLPVMDYRSLIEIAQHRITQAREGITAATTQAAEMARATAAAATAAGQEPEQQPLADEGESPTEAASAGGTPPPGDDEQRSSKDSAGGGDNSATLVRSDSPASSSSVESNDAPSTPGSPPPTTLAGAAGSVESDPDTCSICLDEYSFECKIRTLPCGHCFHRVCVDPWLIKNRNCPLCKLDVLYANSKGVLGIALPSVMQNNADAGDAGVAAACRRSTSADNLREFMIHSNPETARGRIASEFGTAASIHSTHTLNAGPEMVYGSSGRGGGGDGNGTTGSVVAQSGSSSAGTSMYQQMLNLLNIPLHGINNIGLGSSSRSGKNGDGACHKSVPATPRSRESSTASVAEGSSSVPLHSLRYRKTARRDLRVSSQEDTTSTTSDATKGRRGGNRRGSDHLSQPQPGSAMSHHRAMSTSALSSYNVTDAGEAMFGSTHVAGVERSRDRDEGGQQEPSLFSEWLSANKREGNRKGSWF
eukprot:Clim_evm7s167 gene=Clim_evmTU7s167